METYKVLRKVEYLRVSLDNLTREVFRFIPPSTMGCSGTAPQVVGEDALFDEQIKRIDGIAGLLNSMPSLSGR
jgi:hypothetical protein